MSEVRALTHSVLSDIDEILLEHSSTAAKVAFDNLFAGWDDGNNPEYADLWVRQGENGFTEVEDVHAIRRASRDFVGPQERLFGGHVESTPRHKLPFGTLWKPTKNNWDAAAYQLEVVGTMLVQKFYGGDCQILAGVPRGEQ